MEDVFTVNTVARTDQVEMNGKVLRPGNVHSGTDFLDLVFRYKYGNGHDYNSMPSASAASLIG